MLKNILLKENNLCGVQLKAESAVQRVQTGEDKDKFIIQALKHLIPTLAENALQEFFAV